MNAELSNRRGPRRPARSNRWCSLILAHAAGVAPPYGPNLQAVAACLNAGEFVSIELGIARKYPPWAMIAL